MGPVRPLENWEIPVAAAMWVAEQVEVYGSAVELPDAGDCFAFFADVVHPLCASWWVVDENGRVGAMMGLKHEHIAHLYVDPEARNRGLGRRLVEFAKGLYPDKLTVETSHQVAGFYRALGFAEEETLEDEVRMVWAGAGA